MLKGFKEFLLKGNILDLAIAVVMGAAFGALVSSLVENLLTPLIAAIFRAPDFASLSFAVNDSQFFYGKFLNSLISFLIVSASVYFFIVVPVKRLMRTGSPDAAGVATTRACPECLGEIPIQARKCAHCTSVVEPVGVLKRTSGT